MIVNIVFLQNKHGIVTDIVALSDYAEACELEQRLRAQFGKRFVSRTQATVDEIPAFFGLQAQRRPTPTARDGAEDEPHYEEVPDREPAGEYLAFITPPRP